MGHVRARLVVAGAALLALGVLSLDVARGSPEFTFASTAVGGVALVGAGWSLAAAGAVWTLSRQGAVLGPLLVAAGAAWLVAEWGNPGSGSDLVFTVGRLFVAACPPCVAWAALAYPAGRLGTTAARLVVGVAFAAFVGLLGVGSALLFDPAAELCSRCPRNLVLIRSDPAAVDSLSRLGFLAGAVAAAAAIAIAAGRILRAGNARRRQLTPVAVAASVYLVTVAWTCMRSADRGFVATGDVERRLWLFEAGALTALAGAVIWNRVAAHRTRASLARFVVELAATARPGDLRALLGRALHDDSLELAYSVGEGRFADTDGGVVEMPPADDRAATPVVRDGKTVAVLIHRRGRLDDSEVVDNVAAAANLALDNERLQAELRVQENDLRASRVRLIATSDSERCRLERDLHDGAQQRLVGLLLGIRVAQTSLLATDSAPAVSVGLGRAAAEVQQAVDALRTVAHGIHPAVLTDEGLATALEALAEQARFPVALSAVPDGRFAAAVELAAYRVVAGAAKSGPVTVTARRTDVGLIVDVDGRGTPVSTVDLRDRVGALDGNVEVEASGETFRIHAVIPYKMG